MRPDIGHSDYRGPPDASEILDPDERLLTIGATSVGSTAYSVTPFRHPQTVETVGPRHGPG